METFFFFVEIDKEKVNRYEKPEKLFWIMGTNDLSVLNNSKIIFIYKF
jgi:hypothetical protein